MKRSKLIVNLLFCIGIGLFLLFGLFRTLFLPKDINYYENRPANHIKNFTVNAFLDSSFQESVEKALADQVVFAQKMKGGYNFVDSSYMVTLLSHFSKTVPDKYISFCGLLTYGGENIVYLPAVLENRQDDLDNKILNLNSIMTQHSDLDFYAFYIETDSDINFETGEKAGFYEYLKSKLDLPSDHIGVFAIDDFETYEKYFFRTDHHWRNRGSYAGYLDVCRLLNIDNVIKPLEEVELPYRFSGSKAAAVRGTGVITEPFFAYRFDFPQMDIMVPKDKTISDYGRQEDYFVGIPEEISYGSFYGGDEGEIIFDSHQPGERRVLLLGDSYDNALLKLLASHFDALFSVDLRNNTDFHFSEYITANDIDTVLFIGSEPYFVLEDFLIQE